ncbi:MAG: sigma-70 family RNA polymerase sigma factor, partial [Anaerolineae bacterium]|nr:sigma-70 family RNA polymerase sigma factor [Anaerolineae bacterium]
YGLLLNQQDAEDVVQESFVYAFKSLQRYQPERASFKTWLYTIAVSRSRNVHRRKQLNLVELSHQGTHQVPAPSTEMPEAALTRRELTEAVERALANLSPTLREAVVLRYGHGLTYREIAEVMECPPKTAESRVRLAHAKLKEHLQPVGRGLLEDLLRI